ncbi:MAG: molybdopterin converting factor subunit 1 [Planctomycetaceae bacterium]|nr:molybdopterin converting factor subunit 1 [Planctomycetaceae bacterium]
MTLTVQFFARARDLAGCSSVEVELPDGATVAQLRRTLAEQIPALEPILPTLFVAVNNDYASDEAVIPNDAQVACFPPVSGG